MVDNKTSESHHCGAANEKYTMMYVEKHRKLSKKKGAPSKKWSERMKVVWS